MIVLLLVSAFIGHTQEGTEKRKIMVVNCVIDVLFYIYNTDIKVVKTA
jgi:hypothetical protein